MSDLIVRDKNNENEVLDQAPLYLQHYLEQREGRLFSEQTSKPPGRPAARVIERRENLIVLEFEDAPRGQATQHWLGTYLHYLCRNGWDVIFLLFLLGTAVVCTMTLLR